MGSERERVTERSERERDREKDTHRQRVSLLARARREREKERVSQGGVGEVSERMSDILSNGFIWQDHVLVFPVPDTCPYLSKKRTGLGRT